MKKLGHYIIFCVAVLPIFLSGNTFAQKIINLNGFYLSTLNNVIVDTNKNQYILSTDRIYRDSVHNIKLASFGDTIAPNKVIKTTHYPLLGKVVKASGISANCFAIETPDTLTDLLLAACHTPTSLQGAHAANFIHKSYNTTQPNNTNISNSNKWSIYFDGVDDYVDMGNSLNLNSTSFTISAWIKRATGTINASIISKRNAAFTEGYDVSINSLGHLSFNVNGGTSIITSSVPIPEEIWHHIAIVYDNGIATLYIDGVSDTSKASFLAPIATSESFLLGAADGSHLHTTRYFSGNIDEVRIWNRALTIHQLRYMMNQELIDEDTLTLKYGNVIPTNITKNEISNIPWEDLAAYYPMNTYSFTAIKDRSGHNNHGTLKYIDTISPQTAPLPYQTQKAGAWDDTSTWLNHAVIHPPNALSIIDGVTPIDWNNVEVNHNIYLGATPSQERHRNCSVQALIINNGDLQVNGNTSTNEGIGLTVTHYLKIDGTLDLEGESQLIQTPDSDFDTLSTGTLERDQQGTGNTYVYNYWCSPVSPTSNSKYTIASVFENVNFTSIGYNGSTSPVTIADYWIWKYANLPSNNYSNWQHVRSNSNISVGEGFTMKGPGSASNQNYEFKGQPNNGDFSLHIAVDNDYLIGNPYPSALDADAFIRDNISKADGGTNSTNVINGALYFWDHFALNTHSLAEYQGGYSVYTLMGGTLAIASDERINATFIAGSKRAKRYIPVGQGFFVSAIKDGGIAGLTQPITGGNILIKNSQRVFQKEATDGITSSTAVIKKGNIKNNDTDSPSDSRQKLRLMLNSPDGFERELLLGADANASDNFDLGYDAILIETNREDMYWNLNGNSLLIQAIDDFSTTKTLPFSVKISKEGIATIKITELVNIEENKDIYIYDKLLDNYHNIKEKDYNIFLKPGEHKNRFEITFQNNNTLNTIGADKSKHLDITYANESNSLIIQNPNRELVTNVAMFNLIGQLISNFDQVKNHALIEHKLSGTTSGVYLIKATTGYNNVYTQKVIVKN
ncbi:hypothetical protein MHTCC0001_28140 [Flavobacteriaceae bacterium MHTCC 0001]